ncbi:MAG: TIM barrel protein, partial [Pseudomonadota bacterium]
ALNGLAMRYYTDPGFKLGAFTNPDPKVRKAALDITKRGIDACLAMNGNLMTLWMGQDGFDYPFQMDYGAAWDWTINALQKVCDHAPQCEIAIEYKPNEPRAFALMPDIGTTLLACNEASRPNLGVTLDFAHVLYADEMPAHSAYLVGRHSKLLGLHLNDGYGKRDDGLIAGSVHPVATLELLVEAERQAYDGVIYFDTFPDAGGLDPIKEAEASIKLVERLRDVAKELVNHTELNQAIAQQDAATSMKIIAAELYGA